MFIWRRNSTFLTQQIYRPNRYSLKMEKLRPSLPNHQTIPPPKNNSKPPQTIPNHLKHLIPSTHKFFTTMIRLLTPCCLWLFAMPLMFQGCKQTLENAAATPEEGAIDTDPGIRIFYQKVGDGPQITVIPLGFWLYDDFKHLVTDDRTFIFYDMRGRGRSSYVQDTLAISIQKDVHDLEAVRRHFDLPKMSLIGESYLGLMVAMYARQYPDRVEKLVQIGPVPLKFGTRYPPELTNPEPVQTDTAALGELFRLFNNGWANENPDEFSRRWWMVNDRMALLGDTAKAKNYGPQWGGHLQYENERYPHFDRHLRYHFKSIQNLGLKPADFQNLNIPVLVIHGTKDRNAPYGAGREWAEIFPDGTLLTVEGAGHVPWIEQPERVFSRIDEFLKK